MIRTILNGPNDEVAEETTPSIKFQVQDQDGVGLPAASLTMLTMTLYDNTTGNTINSVSGLDVLNANGGTVDVSGNFVFPMRILDNVMVGTLIKESHVALFKWTWSAGTKSGANEIVFIVKNLTKVP